MDLLTRFSPQTGVSAGSLNLWAQGTFRFNTDRIVCVYGTQPVASITLISDVCPSFLCFFVTFVSGGIANVA